MQKSELGTGQGRLISAARSSSVTGTLDRLSCADSPTGQDENDRRRRSEPTCHRQMNSNPAFGLSSDDEQQAYMPSSAMAPDSSLPTLSSLHLEYPLLLDESIIDVQLTSLSPKPPEPIGSKQIQNGSPTSNHPTAPVDPFPISSFLSDVSQWTDEEEVEEANRWEQEKPVHFSLTSEPYFDKPVASDFCDVGEIQAHIRAEYLKWISLFQPVLYSAKGSILSPLVCNAMAHWPIETPTVSLLSGASWQRALCYNPRRYFDPTGTFDVYLSPVQSQGELVKEVSDEDGEFPITLLDVYHDSALHVANSLIHEGKRPNAIKEASLPQQSRSSFAQGRPRPRDWRRLLPKVQQNIFYRTMLAHWEINLGIPPVARQDRRQPRMFEQITAIDPITSLGVVSHLSQLIDPWDTCTSVTIQSQTSSIPEVTSRVSHFQSSQPWSESSFDHLTRQRPNSVVPSPSSSPSNPHHIDLFVIFPGKDQLGLDMTQLAWKILRWKAETSPDEEMTISESISQPKKDHSNPPGASKASTSDEFYHQCRESVMTGDLNRADDAKSPYPFMNKILPASVKSPLGYRRPSSRSSMDTRIVEDISCLYSGARLDLLDHCDEEVQKAKKILLRTRQIGAFERGCSSTMDHALWGGKQSDLTHSAIVNAMMQGGPSTCSPTCACPVCTTDPNTLRNLSKDQSFVTFDDQSKSNPHSRPLVSFLFLDYPGYGFSMGQPNAQNIVSTAYDSIKRAISVCQSQSMEAFGTGCDVNVKFIAYSLGCSIALEVLSILSAEFAMNTAPSKASTCPDIRNLIEKNGHIQSQGGTEMTGEGSKWFCGAPLMTPSVDHSMEAFPFTYTIGADHRLRRCPPGMMSSIGQNAEEDSQEHQRYISRPNIESKTIINKSDPQNFYRSRIGMVALLAPFTSSTEVAKNVISSISTKTMGRVLQPMIGTMLHDDVRWNNAQALNAIFFAKHVADTSGIGNPLDRMKLAILSGTEDDFVGASSGLTLAYHAEVLRRGAGDNDNDMSISFTPVVGANHNNLLSYPHDVNLLRTVNAPARIHPLSRCIRRPI